MSKMNFYSYLGKKDEKDSFYKVKTNKCGKLKFSFCKSEEGLSDTSSKEYDFEDYIKLLHAFSVKGVRSTYSEKNFQLEPAPAVSLEFDENNLSILQLSSWGDIFRTNFDISEVKLPEHIKQLLNEILDDISKKQIESAKYVPLINDMLKKRVLPSLKDDEFSDFMEAYKDGRKESENYLYKKYLDGNQGIWILYILVLDKLYGCVPNQITDSHLLTLVTVLATYIAYQYAKNKGGRYVLKKSLDMEVSNYLKNCKKLESIDGKALQDYSFDILSQATNLDVHNTQFFVAFGRDLTILDCYDDQELNVIKLELLNLGREYVNYQINGKERGIVGVEYLEEYFMKKLSEIEAKIDLKGKTLVSDEKDTINFISENCDVKSDGSITISPVYLNPELAKKIA